MSQRNYIRQSLIKELEQRQKKSLEKKLGAEHPLHVCQEIETVKETIKSDLCEQAYILSSISSFTSKQKRDLRNQKKQLKQLEGFSVDDAIDVSDEIKNFTSDIKEAFVSQVVTD